MTAVGKILVFLNLVFSLVVGGFVIFTYVARVHWVESDKAKDNQIEVLNANTLTYQKEKQKAEQDRDAQVGKVQAELQNSQRDLQAALTSNGELRDQLAKLQQRSNKENALASASGTEVSRRQEEVAKIRDSLRKEQEVNNKLVQQTAEARNEATVAGIELRTIQGRNNRLEGQLQQMAKDMSRMRANGGSTATARSGNAENPPAESVEGLVRRTDPGGLMELTIGSDSGLVKGNTLKLFRLDLSSTGRSKYLGTVRIVSVEAKSAVAQPVGRLLGRPQAGDQVASHISNN